MVDKDKFLAGASKIASGKGSNGNAFNIAGALVDALSKAGMTNAQARAALNREKDINI